jgi:hypothetical protein
MRTPGTFTLASLLLCASSLASGAGPTPVPVEVKFSAALERDLADRYGDEEGATLRTMVMDAVERALAKGAPAGLTVEVVIEDAQPSHPTRRQSSVNPSIDPVRSWSRGGAALSGTLRAADGSALATVKHDHYPYDRLSASPARDAWSDARIAIDGFASRLDRALRAR